MELFEVEIGVEFSRHVYAKSARQAEALVEADLLQALGLYAKPAERKRALAYLQSDPTTRAALLDRWDRLPEKEINLAARRRQLERLIKLEEQLKAYAKRTLERYPISPAQVAQIVEVVRAINLKWDTCPYCGNRSERSSSH